MRVVLDLWRSLGGHTDDGGNQDPLAAVVSAAVSGDAARAQAAVARFFAGIGAEDTGHGRDHGGRVSVAPAAAAGDVKLGRRVATEIAQEISAAGWPVGRVLGVERDLLERYGVSRAVLREAVRILESWSIVAPRRGRGGGLAVAVPDYSAVRSAARVWLDHAGIRRSQLFEVREAMDALAVRSLVARHADEATIGRLRAVLRDEEAVGAAFVVGGLDVARPSLSIEIARCSGNPVLALFTPVVIDLARLRPVAVAEPDVGMRWVRQQHTQIVDAIAARDAPLAELMVRRYVAAVAGMPADERSSTGASNR